MNSFSDPQLLRDYTESRSEPAFAELVRRHVDFVYSAALRMVRDPHLAEDITQSTFVALAQNARQLTEHPTLSGWLHRTAQNLAGKTVRSDIRRRAREEESAAMNELIGSEADATWEQIAPEIDAALNDLSEPDHDALFLRYFQRKSAREMAQALGVSEEAAQKRVNRAVNRLRELFLKRGLSVGASALGIVISANAVQAAPTALVTTVLTAAKLSGVGIATTSTTAHAILMTTTQKVIFATALTAIIGTGLYEFHRASDLEDRLHDLESQQGPLVAQVRQSSRERDEATNKIAASQQEMELLRRELAGLPKLRGEVTRLQRDAQDSAQTNAGTADPMQREMKSWLRRVTQLKEKFEQTPEAKIPEFQFLTEQDWLNAAKSDLNDEKDYRRAMSALRGSAENKFVNQLQPALKKYLKEHDKNFPTDISELQPYFNPPVDDAMLRRYGVLPSTDIPNLGMGGLWIISQKAAIDEEYDNRIGIGPNGWGNTGPQGWKTNDPLVAAGKLLEPISNIYKAAHNGMEPTTPSDVIPYLTTPEQRAAYDILEKAFKEHEATDK